jgi:hypothetical protein
MPRVLALYFCWILFTGGLAAENLLVLPFFNYTESDNLDWIGESVAETLREVLVSEGVLVVNRDDRQEGYRRLSLRTDAVLTKASVLKLGEVLDADQVLYGRFEVTPASGATGRTLRVTAQLLDLRRLKSGPEFLEMGALEDLAALQNHLAWQTLQLVTPKTSPSEQEFRERRPVVRVDAIENYVRGLLAKDPEVQLRLFGQAARLDPRYSQPCFHLGRQYFQSKNYRAAA